MFENAEFRTYTFRDDEKASIVETDESKKRRGKKE